MPDRTYSPPPPITVTIAGRTLSLRFVDCITVDGDPWRRGWVDAERGELQVSLAPDDRLGHLPTLIGGAIVDAMWELCPAYGVTPADTGNCLDPDVCLDGPVYRAWLKVGVAGTLAELSDATRPAVRQRPDGRWACPRCRRTFANVPRDWGTGSPRLAIDHVMAYHGIDRDDLRAIPFRPRTQPTAEGGGSHA